MSLARVNEVIEEFYKLFYETEDLALKQGIKCLTTTELHVIEAIGFNSLSMNELSEKLGITMGTATVAINKLSDKGFIKRERSGNDRRKVFVSLSNKGVEALNYHNNYHKMIISNITKDINEENLEIFTEVFEKILVNLRNQVEYFKPDTITNFEKGSVVTVVEVKGTPVVKNYFMDRGIKLYSEIEILSNNLKTLSLKNEDGKIVEINVIDSRNLVVIKKNI